MIQTLPLEEIVKYADNVYEAIIVLAKRARQINDEQKQLLFRETEDDYDDYDEEGAERDYSEIEYIRLPKPTTIALEEFLAGKINFEYHKPSEEEENE